MVVRYILGLGCLDFGGFLGVSGVSGLCEVTVV